MLAIPPVPVEENEMARALSVYAFEDVKEHLNRGIRAALADGVELLDLERRCGRLDRFRDGFEVTNGPFPSSFLDFRHIGS